MGLCLHSIFTKKLEVDTTLLYEISTVSTVSTYLTSRTTKEMEYQKMGYPTPGRVVCCSPVVRYTNSVVTVEAVGAVIGKIVTPPTVQGGNCYQGGL